MLSYPVPQKLFTKLRLYTVGGLTDAILSAANKVYCPTSYYDIEPDVGGPSFGGYTLYASIYSRYRVIKYDYEISWSNLESDSVMVAVYPIPASSVPSELASSASPELAIENNFSKHFLLGPKGGNNASRTMRGHVDCQRVWGTPEVLFDTSWASAIGTSPGANTWLMLSGQRINLAAFSLGAQFTITVTAHGYWDQKISVSN